MITGFECCFCKQSIEENNIDPCDLNIIINSEMKKKSQDRSSQNFYAHFLCLKKKLHEDMRGLFVLDSE